jgi:hypothetical protein
MDGLTRARAAAVPVLVVMSALLAGPAAAQTSASFKLEEHTFNNGGHPDAGTVMTSASFRMTTDALGDGIVGTGLTSPSFHADAGFGSAYPPPSEVLNLRFTSADTLVWNPERSVGVYNLYRDSLTALSGLGYGQCEQFDLLGETATDTDPLAVSDGFFYLVTAENRRGEEGTKGFDSLDVERPNPSACP